MARATQAIIDLAAIESNYRLAKQHAPDAQAFAVIKANAYGHGLVDVGMALAPLADGLAVACVDEAEQLRQAGVSTDILVLEGAYDQDECEQAAASGFELVLHEPRQLEWLAQVSTSLTLWIKIDTGMHRLGFAPEQVNSVLERLERIQQSQQVQHNIGLMSHFACADEPDDTFNQMQLSVFKQFESLSLPMSMSNSAAILSCPSAHKQRIRPGIMLYGASPFAPASKRPTGLKPAMTLTSEVIAVHALKAGETVGYGQTWRAQRDCKIAVVAIGYGDGYPRQAPNGTPVVINGQRARLAGRVSMDMITVDVTDLDSVELGDPVELWGEQLPADEIAQACNTIAYELFCQVTPRVPRFYRR